MPQTYIYIYVPQTSTNSYNTGKCGDNKSDMDRKIMTHSSKNIHNLVVKKIKKKIILSIHSFIHSCTKTY